MTEEYFLLIPDQRMSYFAVSADAEFNEQPVPDAELVTVIEHEIRNVVIRDIVHYDPYQGNLVKRRIEKRPDVSYEWWCEEGKNHTKTENLNMAVYERDLEYLRWVIKLNDLNAFFREHPFESVRTNYQLNGVILRGLMLIGYP